MFKNQKGITLIALVITIIVLLILAGITIAMLSGGDSAPAKAKEASALDKIGAAKDAIGIQASVNMSKFYDEKYVQNKGATVASGSASNKLTYTTVQEAVYAAGNAGKTDGVKAQNGVTISQEKNNTIKITYDADNAFYSEGAVDEDGTITWKDKKTNN